MANNKAISDEQIIAALLSNGTFKAAAAAAGISERSLYDRMGEDHFANLYACAKADLIRSAVITLNSHLQEAVETVAKIMNDENTNPATRLQAAQSIMNNATKLAQRLGAEEHTIKEEIGNEKFRDRWGY